MQHYYDAQIRRYITQTIRFFSNFVVKYSDGTLNRIPVMYGDIDRQVASTIRQNSENAVTSIPRISVYVADLKLDRDRLSDSTFVGKLHIRERGIDTATGTYNGSEGRNYTVEKLMPTPFSLTMKVDILTANTDQKLQIVEQVLMFFNPSLELQTTDNYIDWTSLTVLNLNDINWSSRSIPVGNNLVSDVATLTVETPIWISPPAKVKQLGVITNIITSLYQDTEEVQAGYIEGIGIDTTVTTSYLSNYMTGVRVYAADYNISVYGNEVTLLAKNSNVVPPCGLNPPTSIPSKANWQDVLDLHPGKFIQNVSNIRLLQPNGSEVIGTVSYDELTPTVLTVQWDEDTYSPNTGIDSAGRLDTDIGYNSSGSNRPNSPGTFDAIVNPLKYNPKRPNNNPTDQPIVVGTRFLLVEDIGSVLNDDGPDGWKSTSGVDFIAHANDIIEWDGSSWNVLFDSRNETDTLIWQTNIYTNIQYLWNGISWVKSFDGVYYVGKWRLVF